MTLPSTVGRAPLLHLEGHRRAMEAWFADLARWVRRHERGLLAPGSACTLRIDIHHFYYLLVHCEGLGLRVGPLERTGEHAPVLPSMHVADVDRSDAQSILSIQDTVRTVSTWWSRTPTEESADRMYRYLHRVLTQLTSLTLTAPAPRDAEGAQTFPGHHLTPLHACVSLTHLGLEGLDPRCLVGWDRLALQLVSLRCVYSPMQDVTDLLESVVLRDAGHGMPSAAWHQLRELHLAQNELTFVPSGVLAQLPALVYLDLSHNLLNAVPPALAEAAALRGLNVSHNMIDSVLGIYEALPRIRALNLGENRLSSLCGVERLLSLAQVDLRGNELDDAGEVGRLATLPHISHAWIAGNPLGTSDGRIACFAAFAQEDKHVVLDDAPCGFWEQRQVAAKVVRRARQPLDDAPREAQLAAHVNRVHLSTRTPSTPPPKAARRPRKSRARASLAPLGAQDAPSDAPPPDAAFPVHAALEARETRVAPVSSTTLDLFMTPVGAAITSVTLVSAGAVVWWRFFRRLPTAAHITPAVLASRRAIVGRVTRYAVH